MLTLGFFSVFKTSSRLIRSAFKNEIQVLPPKVDMADVSQAI